MLQQILRDLWVDPAILAELDDEQRQTLFCKMREEQVRRWRIWDAATVIPNRKPPAPGAKTVQFLSGKDGEPWVWVMGEHPDDLSVDEILEKEAREKARKQAQLEAEELRKKVEDELSELLDQNERQISSMERNALSSPSPPPLPPRQISPPPLIESLMNEHEDIYCSVDELRAKSKVLKSPLEDENNEKSKKPVSERVAQWERRLLEERTAEILGRMRRRRMDSVREAEESAVERERLWQEQEKKAKEAEQQIREIARRAREEHRRASILDKTTEPLTITPPTSNGLSAVQAACIAAPMGRDAVCKWFWSSEVPRAAAVAESGAPEPWFHGLISRHEAESLLEGKLKGTFLVRVSERIRGYVISYRDWKCCKHFLVDCSGPFYQFLGAGQIGHHSLSALVRHHRDRPITQVGAERLHSPCVCTEPPEILRIGCLNI